MYHMIEWQRKRNHQAENPVIGWICDAYDSVKSFFTDPYLIDRLLNPASRLIERSEAASERIQAASEKRNEKKNAHRARRIRNKEQRAERRRSAVQRVNILTLRNASAVIMVCTVIFTMGHILTSSIKKVVSSSESMSPVSASDTAYDSVEANAFTDSSYDGTDASVSAPETSAARTDAAGAGADVSVPSLEREYGAVEDTQAVIYAENNKTAENADGSSSSAQRSYPPVYIYSKGSILTPSDFGHGHRFAGMDHRLMMDVSSNQSKIDWDAASASGIEAVMIRVGYRGRNSGRLYEDDWYKYNLRETERVGMPVGVYFYSQAITIEEAKEEARFLIDRIGRYNISLPVAIDYEYESMSVYGELSGRLYDARLSVDQATNIVLAFCREIAAKGYTPMVYANKDMLSNNLDSYSISGKYNVWLACYARRATYGDVYNFWQFTDSGCVDGVRGNVCLDFWYCE